MKTHLKHLAAALAFGVISAGSATASILSFNDVGDNLPESYGDRISATHQDGIRYYSGVGVGWTPNVTVDYGGADLRRSTYGYGNFTDAIYHATEGSDFGITFNADDGYGVALYDFQLALSGNESFTIDNISFFDGSGTLLTQIADLAVTAGSTRTTVDLVSGLGGPLAASTISIIFDISGLGNNSDKVGFDNFTFGQFAWADLDEDVLVNPLPAGLPLFISGLGAIGWVKSHRRKKSRA
ncbi:MAG: hypothetical protein DHS20C05_20090 [Hyphococcus sp.]|nr:MAG: hypothetical protein DHS20C05_20090 [Marinicaulis sp.]